MKQLNKIYNSWWAIYKNHVQEIVLNKEPDDLEKISYWRSAVFCKILTYLTPLSLVALIPGVFMAFMNGVPVVGFTDLFAFFTVLLITVSPGIKLEIRKALFILILYCLSITLLYYLPLPGPGLLFLLTVTIFSSLIYSSAAAYLSAWTNTIICICFAQLIYFGIESPISSDYALGAWVATSSNVVLLSFACAKCLDILLEGLNNSIKEKIILANKLEKSNHQYQFLSQINQTIVHVKDPETLFRKSCSIALEYGKYKMGWIGGFDITQKKITLLDSCGIPEQDINLFTDVAFEINDPQNYVLGTGRYFLCNHIEHSVELESWKSYAEKYNIRSCIVLPIKKSGEIFGTFNLYASEINYFDKDDIALLLEVTGDISFALGEFDKAKRHKEAEELILKNEKLFRVITEKSLDMKTLATVDGKITYASPSVTRVIGYTVEELLEIPVFDLVHPEDISELAEKIQNVLKTPGKFFSNQHRILHKNLNWIWCEGTFTNMLHEPGINALVSNFRDVSEKRSIEIQRQFDRNNLDALINNTNDMMWSVDRDFNLITSNLPFNDMVGLTLSNGGEIGTRKNVLNFRFTQDQSQNYKKYYERAFAGEAFTEIEFIDYPEEYWSKISFNPIKKGEEIIGAACHSHNITQIIRGEREKKRLEKAVENERQRFYHLFSEAPSSMGVLSGPNHVFEIVNPLYLKLIGKKDIIGKTVKEVLPEAVDQGLIDLLDGVYKTGKTFSSNEMLVRLDTQGTGQLVDKYLNFVYQAHRTESDKIDSILFFAVDVTEQVVLRQKIEESEARLKEAQAIAHISNWEIDLLTDSHTWSDEFYNICGIVKGERQPSFETFLSFIHPEDVIFAEKEMQETFETLEASSMNFRILTKEGAIKHGYTEWKFEFDVNNNPTRLYGILQDLTGIKIAEEEREKLIHDLLQRNRDLEQFTFIISHNLRAPTANIIGFNDMLQLETVTLQERKGLLHGLASSVKGLDTIIKDINTILQVKSEINEKKELVSFSKCVNDIFTSHGLKEKYQVRIKSDFSEVDGIFSLKVYMYSIFYNLISNSIKYGKPDEQSLIEIKSKQEKGKIILTFKDNGLGIDMDTNSDKIFGLYKRFHSHVEGKGMGLFMVKTQVEAIGGKITVASQLNKGTEFIIVFEN